MHLCSIWWCWDHLGEVFREFLDISFDFDQKIWTIRDVTNPYVTAVSEAPFRSLVIGNYLWTITNDTECSKEVYSKYLSLTSCSNDQFTCNDGLCISIHQR